MSEQFIPRFGHIIEIHPENNRVKVDFDGNPHGSAVWASIGRAFTSAQIYVAIDNQLACKIEFFAGDISLPILTDIYFSVFEQDTLTLRAKSILIEGEQSVEIKSGNAKTTLDGRTGHLKNEAQYITSDAEKAQKIRAQKISLN
ncbi:hypothetical protein [Vibrio mexicanus]|uniref:hypothetical protein n=1 Tax=Vibrio mexicanus TaxID=1004326 RepID=UPI000A3EB34F|nr:hypothetical protein [Vibrio mexicanus]